MANIASISRRLGAYAVDIGPIVFLIFGIFYFQFGFDEILSRWHENPGDIRAKADFLVWRNRIRDISFLVWIIYCAISEASAWQGTLGKKILNIRVTDMDGKRLSLVRSIGRNLFKIVSLLALGLGFIWILFRKDRRSWHDLLAKTQVVTGGLS